MLYIFRMVMLEQGKHQAPVCKDTLKWSLVHMTWGFYREIYKREIINTGISHIISLGLVP